MRDEVLAAARAMLDLGLTSGTAGNVSGRDGDRVVITAAAVPYGAMTVADLVELDLSGAVDFAAERKRLEKDLAAAETERSRAIAKLGNEAFLGKAPEAVVVKVRAQLEQAEADVERLEAQLAALPDA